MFSRSYDLTIYLSLNSRPPRRTRRAGFSVSRYSLSESRRFGGSKADGRANRQELELESAVSTVHVYVILRLINGIVLKAETIDIQLPASTDEANSSISLERSVCDL